MNWLAVEETENNYSIRPQCLLSLSDSCILSLVSSLKCCYRRTGNDSVESLECALSQIIRYFKSNLLTQGSNRPVLPYWISDRLLTHILADNDFPTKFFNGLFSNTFCSLNTITLPQHEQTYFASRLSQLGTFSLTSLNLFGSLVTDSLLQSIASSKSAVSLKVLKLRECIYFKRISSLECFPNLTHLDVSENNLEFGNLLPLGVLSLIIKQFPDLVSLDLHLTNFTQLFSVNIDNAELQASRDKLFTELSPTPALRELYLYTNIWHDLLNSAHLKLFYSSLHRFFSLTHLDLSAWPDLEKLSNSDLAKLSDGLLFLGLYHTPLTLWKCELNIRCKEISGFANGEQIISAMQRYSDMKPYMDELYLNLFNSFLNRHLSLTSETILKMVRLVLNSLDKCLNNIPKCDHMPPELKENKPSLLKWTACLYTLLAELKPNIPPDVVTRGMNTCIVFFHKINVADNLNENVAVLTTNICLIYSLLVHEGVSENTNESMDYILCKFLFGIINISCMSSSHLISNDHHLYRLLGQVLRILYRFLFRKDPIQKGLIGTKLGGVSSLMRLIAMKLDEKKSDEHIRHASGALMNLTYLSLPNCMELSQKLHSDLLVRLIEEYSEDSKRDVVGLIMASVENIAEFCLQDERASVSSQLLSPVLAVLSSPARYNQDALACAIAVSAYYAVGAERWHWEETGEEALRLAEKAIGQIDYKVPRSQSLDTLEFLVECLHARDTRVQLCALWLLCNLVYKQADSYVKMLNEDSLETIHSIISNFPKDSQHYLLGSEIIHLYDITKKCAEFKY